MKKIIVCLIMTALMLSCIGCGQSDDKSEATADSVGTEINENAETLAAADAEDAIDYADIEEAVAGEAGEGADDENVAGNEDAVDVEDAGDYDLTAMSSTMVYAKVYQMMIKPEEYIGKKIKMSGQYYASYYDSTELYYHYCIIADATACCSQGIEFIWGDGDHVYPDEYPENYTEIVVEGTYGTYEELGVNYLCILNATMEAV